MMERTGYAMRLYVGASSNRCRPMPFECLACGTFTVEDATAPFADLCGSLHPSSRKFCIVIRGCIYFFLDARRASVLLLDER